MFVAELVNPEDIIASDVDANALKAMQVSFNLNAFDPRALKH